jgi:hypothetical protein
MPFIADVERSSEKEVEGAFKISAKGVNLWVRVYRTNFGGRVKVTVSYLEGNGWKQTPAIWLDAKTCAQLAERLKNIADKL